MNLNLENIDNLFQDNLETMEITPSPSVKQAVKKRMFYRNIIKGTYFKLASTAIVLLIVGTASFFVLSNNNVDDKNISSSQITKISTIGNTEIEINDISSNKTNNKTEVNKPETKNIITSNNKKTEKNIIADNNITDNKTANNLKENIVINNADENVIEKQENIQVEKNQEKDFEATKKTNIIADEIQNNKTKKSAFAEAVSEINSDIPAENNLKENTFAIEKSKSKSSLSLTAQTAKNDIKFIDTKQLVLLNQSKELQLPIINIPDDTIGFTVSGEEIIGVSNHWFVGVDISPNYSFINYSVTNQENSSLVDKLNSSSSNSLAFDLGAEVGYQFKNISLISGINFTQYDEQFNAEYEETLIEEINYWEYNDYTQTIYDTTNYVNIDSLIQGDTTYTQIIDSTQITLTDSTLSSTNDTSVSRQNMKYVNKYKYIEIPLTIEFTFNRVKKFSPFIRTGLITGLHIRTQGFTYSVENNEQLIENTDLPYVKANFWLLFGVGIRYNLNDRFSVLVYPYYRYHLNDLINDDSYYRQSLNNMGIKFGVRYMF